MAKNKEYTEIGGGSGLSTGKGNEYFARFEKKYLASDEQASAFLSSIASRLQPDIFPSSDVNNVYYDTPDRRLIRRSLDKPTYKEKLRLRAYGTEADLLSEDAKAFVELKKKFKGIVYKRRLLLPLQSALDLLDGRRPPEDQIEREVRWMFQLYPGLAPAYYIGYHRDSVCGVEDKELRITVDRDIVWREEDPGILSGRDGRRLLPQNMRIIELKVHGSVPLWLCHALDENKIKPATFSKYGNAFRQNTQPELFELLSGGFLPL